MNSIICWKRELQVAALGAVVLLSACQSQGLAPQPNTGLQPNIAPAQMTVQRTRGSMAGQRFQPCNGVVTPVVAGTPLPSYTARTTSVGYFSATTGTDLLYIADQSLNQIDIFPVKGLKQPQVGSISAGIDGPYGLWYDRGSESLYVANQVNNTVTVYPYGATQPSLTYSQDLDRPLYPIVDRHGELYVGNANNGTVVEYLAGSTNVYQVLQTPGSEADGMALDRHGNLYVAYRGCGSGSIEKFAPGSTQGHVIGMTLDQPQGVFVDSHDDVVATETGSTNRIDLFPPGSKTPSLEVSMPQGSVATELVIDCDFDNLYVSGLYSGIVFGVKYPLPGKTLFVKDEVSTIIQGVTITNNQEF